MDLTTLKTEDELISAYAAITGEDPGLTRFRKLNAMSMLMLLEEHPNRELLTRSILLEHFSRQEDPSVFARDGDQPVLKS